MVSSTIHFILVGRGIYALSLLRILGVTTATTEDRVWITLGTSVEYDVGSLCRFVRRVIRIPRPDRDLDAFKKSICNYVLSLPRSQRIVILPVVEETIFMSQIADELREEFKTAEFVVPPTVWVSPFHVLADLHHKFQFQKRMAEVFDPKKTSLQLSSENTTLPKVPFTAHVRNPDQLFQAVGKCFERQSALLRVVVKPCWTRGGQGMHILTRGEWNEAKNKAELKQHFLRRIDFSNYTEYVVQEFVEGHEISSFSVCANGKVLAHVCYEPRFMDAHNAFAPIRDLMCDSSSSSRYRRSLEFVQSVATSLGLTGQFGFDFMECYDGRLVALECNPRATNGLAFFSPRFCTFTAQQLKLSLILALSTENGIDKKRVERTDHTVISPTSPNHLMTVFPTLIYLGKLLMAKPQDENTFGVLLELASAAYDDVWWRQDPLPWLVSFFRLIVLVMYACVQVILGNNSSIINSLKDFILDEIVSFHEQSKLHDPITHENWESVGQESMDKCTLREMKKIEGKLNVLVTGATGFLGGRLVQVLHNGFFEGNRSLKFPFSLDSIQSITATGRNEQRGKKLLDSLNANEGKTRFVRADLCDVEQTYRLVNGQHVVFHCAALCAPWGRWDDFISANKIASQNVVHACCLVKSMRRLVYISSPSICLPLDAKEKLNIKEIDPLPAQEKQPNRYSATKKIAEEIVLDVSKHFNLPCIVLRPRAIFGPGDTTLMPLVIDRLTRRKLPVIGSNDCIGDFTYVDNVVYACICCLACDFESPKIFSITNDEPQFLWKTVIRTICDQLQLQYPTKRLPQRLAYMIGHICECLAGFALLFGLTKEPILTRYSVNVLSQSCTLDISAAKQELNYKPIFSFKESIREYIKTVQKPN